MTTAPPPSPARLVTLLGPGSLGTTRTAQEAARRADADGAAARVAELLG